METGRRRRLKSTDQADHIDMSTEYLTEMQHSRSKNQKPALLLATAAVDDKITLAWTSPSTPPTSPHTEEAML